MIGLFLIPIINRATEKRGTSIAYFIAVAVMSLFSWGFFRMLLAALAVLGIALALMLLSEVPALRKRVTLENGPHMEDGGEPLVTLGDIIDSINNLF